MKTTATFDPSLYVVVPREPTIDMKAYGGSELYGSGELYNHEYAERAASAYRAMLAAAPPLPEQPQGEKIITEMRRRLVNVLNEDECSALDYLISIAQPQDVPLFVIFDGPPSHQSGRFIEVETTDRRSVNAGEWKEREDGLWSLGPLYAAPAGAAAPATAQAPFGKPLFQVKVAAGKLSSAWVDATEEQYDGAADWHRRVLWLATDRKASSVTRASVPDEPQPAVRESVGLGKDDVRSR